MKQYFLVPALTVFLAIPTHAQAPSEGDGASLIEQGLELLLQELLTEIKPALDDFQSLGVELAPKIMELMELVDDFRNYETPEKLPNGDILIRRTNPIKEGEIDL